LKKLAREYAIELDVYSSYRIYGTPERDRDYDAVFDQCRSHPKIRYHGTVSNDEVRQALQQAHVFAYPCITQETSCISLMEAMSAGCLCVHPNLAALPETSANWTNMYQYSDELSPHMDNFYNALRDAVQSYWRPRVQERLQKQKQYADEFFGWEQRVGEWTRFLKSLLA
jgi:UDP-glucose:(glucosyl)LPS alpha-1,2-glucosyltransferase